MWLVTENGFISVVEDKEDASLLQVRARDARDICATFPDAEVYIVRGADYQHRARVAREVVAERMAEMVRSINYQSHFKDHAVLTSPPNPARLGALYGCWHALSELQDYRPYSTVPRSEEPAAWWDEGEG